MFEAVEEAVLDDDSEPLSESRAVFDAINEILAYLWPNKIEGWP